MQHNIMRMALAAAALLVLGTRPTAAQLPLTADIEDLALRLAAAPVVGDPDASVIEDAGSSTTPPDYEADHPYLLLHGTMARLRCVSGAAEARDCTDTVPAGEQAAFVRAHDAALRGFRSYSGMEPDLRRAGRFLAAAVRKLPRRGSSTSLAVAEELRAELTEAIRQMALRIIDRATVADVDAARLRRAGDDMLRADQLATAGETAKAAGVYTKPLKLKNALVFDMDRFEQGIRNAFDSQTIGYAYAINRHGQLAREDANGSSRLPGESNPTLQDPRKRMNIASVTKNLTAVALLQQLEQRGIADTESIAPYLPPDWTLGPGLENLSFRDLLRHESGLDNNSGASGGNFGTTLVYSGLQNTIAGGQTGSKTFRYQNVNYALFRVIIPTLLWGGNPVDLLPADNVILPEDNPSLTSLIYQAYVVNFVLDPSGVTSLDANGDWAGLTPTAPTQTLSYFFPNASGNVSGAGWGNWNTISGGGGWYLSAYDLAAYMAHVRYDDALLSPAARQRMNDNFYGYHDPAVSNFYASFANGKFGVYRAHGGDLGNGGTPSKGMGACIMNFSEGVQAAVLINSVGGSYTYQCNELQEAFDASFVKK